MPKVQADLSQFKHPNSRKTNALIKKIQKAKSRDKQKQSTSIKQNLIGEKLLWFKDNLEQNCEHYTPTQTLQLIEKYLSRFQEELEQIQLKHSIGNRKNRQHASREDIIKMTITNEQDEFRTGGIEIPDLLNAVQFKLLNDWNGELRFLSKFKLKRYNKCFLEKAIQENSDKCVVNNKETTDTTSSMDL